MRGEVHSGEACGHADGAAAFDWATMAQRDVRAWMLLGHPQATEEWLRRRNAARVAGVDPDRLDDN
jgi:acetyl-CoA acetyltransferase